MNLKPFQQYQLVPPHTACELLDPDEEAYFSVGIWANDADDEIDPVIGPVNLLVEVLLLPLRGRDPASAAIAVALDDIVLGMWCDGWLKAGEPSHIDRLAPVVASVERWLRESQRFDDLCAIQLPDGFRLDVKLYLTDYNEWGYALGYSPPLGEWWLLEGDDGETISMGGSDPVAELADPINEFSAAHVAAWTRPLTIARKLVKEFLANKVQVSEMLARIEPEMARQPIVLDPAPAARNPISKLSMMDGKSFRHSRLVPFEEPCELLDRDRDIYLSVTVSHSTREIDSVWFFAASADLVDVILLPLRGRSPAEAVTALAFDEDPLSELGEWLVDLVGPLPVVRFAQAVTTMEWWLRESQRFDDLCALGLPRGFFVTAQLHLTGHNLWNYMPGYSPPSGEWWLMDKDDVGVAHEGIDPIAMLTDPEMFSAAYAASWMHPLTVAYEMVQQFQGGKVRASEMLARIEPEMAQCPTVLDLTPAHRPA
jgi:hypothetical protein